MGGSKSQTTTSNATSKTTPWEQAQPGLENIMGQVNSVTGNLGLSGTEQNAFAGLLANAQQGNQYAPAVGRLATDLLNGGTDRTGMVTGAHDELRASLMPYTTASTNPWENADFTRMVDNLSNDALNKVKAQYAAAGYDPSAATFGKSVGEGISRSVAPLAWQATNDLEARKLGAIQGLYGAGNTTAGLLSGLDQTALANRQAGVGAASSALEARDAPLVRQLELESQRLGIPMQRLAQAESLILPAAQAFGTTNQNSTSTTTQKSDPTQAIIGAAMAGLGLMTGNPMMAMGGMGGGWGGMGSSVAPAGMMFNTAAGPSAIRGWYNS